MKSNGLSGGQDLVQLLLKVVQGNGGNGFNFNDSQSVASEEPLPLQDVDRDLPTDIEGQPAVKTEEVKHVEALKDQEEKAPEVAEIRQEQELQLAKASMKQEVSKSVEKKQTVAETLAQLKKAYVLSNGVKKSEKEKNADGAEKNTQGGASMQAKQVPPGKSKKRKAEDEKEEKQDEKKHAPEKQEKKGKPDAGKKKCDKKKVIPKNKEKKEEKPRRALSMTKKCVTSRAYHRVMDANKHLPKEEAKVLARQASYEAGVDWEKEYGSKD